MPLWNPKANDIFLDALEIATPDERLAYVESASQGQAELRADVEGLLHAHDEAGRFLEGKSPHATRVATPASAISEVLGTSIGPYKLREVLGEGGMGIVYAAEQEQPLRRKVALKVIKPGMDSREVIARMEVERQALALLDHPNIAKVIDAGTTESGRPYFVMELVRGLPITDYCDRCRLPPRERLKLFMQVCQAVQHAHQRGIIHRDLKPSNVMITLHDGVPVPKIIDFGVAKALNQRLTEQTLYTRVAQLLGTPMYMSPEQAELSGLDVDTRSDVYSLGVLLYELLTGQTPFDKETFLKAGYDELRRMIREDEPPRPSQRISTLGAVGRSTVSAERGVDDRQLARTLRGELDWIVMKALEKDRTRRYGSADALAADVERYLDDEPVEACPPTTAYRLRKFAWRNKTALVTTGLVVVALITGTAVSVWQAVEATHARQLADERLVLADERLDLANERLKRETKALEEAVTQRQDADEQRQLAETNFQTALNAVDQMLTRVADEKLAHIHDAEPVRKELLEQALQFYEQFLAQRSDDFRLQFEVAKAWQRVGFIKSLLADWPGSAQALDRAITIADTQLRDFPDDVKYLELLAESLARQGSALPMVGVEHSPAIEVLDRGLTAIERLQQLIPNNREHRRIAGELHLSRGELLIYAGFHNQSHSKHHDESFNSLSIAVQIHRQLFEDDGRKLGDRGRLMWNLAFLGYVVGIVGPRDFDQGDRLLAEAEELGRTLPPAEQIGAPDTVYGDPINALAMALAFRADLHLQKKRGNSAEQEAWLRRAMTLLDVQLAAHPKAIQTRYCRGHAMRVYGEFLAVVGRTDEAERLYRDMCRELLVDYKHDYHHKVRGAIEQLTAILQESGRQDDEELATFKLQFYENLDAYPMDSDILKRRAAFRFELRKYREALEDLTAAVEKNPDDTSNLTWIPTAAVAACPDVSFRTGLLALADETITRTNGSAAAYDARAQLYAAMGDSEAARRDLDSCVASPMVAYSARYKHALLCLAMNDEAAYRADCAEMLRQFRDSQNYDELYFTVWTSVLALDAVAGMDEAIELARRAVEIGSADRRSLVGLGAALFRAGRYQEALEGLERSDAAPANDNTSPAYAWYFLAMTCFKMDKPVEARRWYDKAVESTEKILVVAKTARAEAVPRLRKLTLELMSADGWPLAKPSEVPWNRKLTLELLRREAQALIQPDDPSAPADAAAVESTNFSPTPALPE